MSLPTVSDVQPVDPILTNLALGYMQADSRFVADKVFPGVSVDKDSGTYFIYTKKYWFLNEMKTRAPGGQYARAGFGVESSTYVTQQWALSYPIPDEVQANSQLPLSLESLGARWLSQQAMIRKELSFSTDFMKTSVWGTDDTTTTDWDDFTSGDPRNDILTAVRTISNNTGYKANTIVMGNIVEQALLLHPDILDALKYTAAANLANVRGALAAMLGLSQILVAEAVYSNTNENAAFAATNIIDDDALVCYVEPSPSPFSASAGYSFFWQPGGGMGGIRPKWRDENADTDLLKFKMQWDQKAVATDLGYFFSDIV
jgi:hypothetical protein